MRTVVFNLTVERNKKPLAMVVLIPHPSIAIELFGVIDQRWTCVQFLISPRWFRHLPLSHATLERGFCFLCEHHKSHTPNHITPHATDR